MRGLSYLTLWSGLSCPPRPRVLQGRADTSPALAERLLSSQCRQRSPRAPPTRRAASQAALTQRGKAVCLGTRTGFLYLSASAVLWSLRSSSLPRSQARDRVSPNAPLTEVQHKGLPVQEHVLQFSFLQDWGLLKIVHFKLRTSAASAWPSELNIKALSSDTHTLRKPGDSIWCKKAKT